MSRLGRNTATLLAFAAADGVLGWVQLKWLAVHLGTSGIGLFAVLSSVGGVLMLAFNPGLPLLVTRWTASLEAQGHTGPSARLALGGALYAFALGLAGTAASFAWPGAAGRAWAPLLPVREALPWAVMFFASVGARQMLYAVWNGRRRMEIPALVDLAQIAVVTARLFFQPRLDLATFFQWNALSSVAATLLCAAWLAPRLARAAASGKAPLPPADTAEIRRYAAWSAFTSVTAVGFDYVDRLVLAERMTAADVSYFHVPARWLQFLRRLLSQPLSALFPELARGPLEARRAALSAFVEGYSLLGLGSGLALALSPAAFIHLLASPAFDRGVPVLCVLALVPPLMGMYAPLTTALRASGRMRQGAISDFAWVAVYLGTGAALVGRVGPVGLAVGQVAASVASLGWNLYAGRGKGWLQMPWGPLARQWGAALLCYFAGRAVPGGDAAWARALAGCALFAVLVRFTGGFSRDARHQVRARLPERARGAFDAVFGRSGV